LAEAVVLETCIYEVLSLYIGKVTYYLDRFVLVSVCFSSMIGTVELHLSGRWLSGSPIIRIGLALRVNLSRILQK